MMLIRLEMFLLFSLLRVVDVVDARVDAGVRQLRITDRSAHVNECTHPSE